MRKTELFTVLAHRTFDNNIDEATGKQRARGKELFMREHQQFNPVDVVDSSKALPNLPNIFQFPSTALRLNQSILKNVSQTEMLFPAIDAVFSFFSLFITPTSQNVNVVDVAVCCLCATSVVTFLFYRYIDILSKQANDCLI